MSLAYSINGEEYDDSLEDLLESYFTNECFESDIPATLDIWVGEAIPHMASKFFDCAAYILDSMRDNAGDNCGECADVWLENVTPAQESDLSEMIKVAIDAWAMKHDLQPKFFNVEDAHQETIQVKDYYHEESK